MKCKICNNPTRVYKDSKARSYLHCPVCEFTQKEDSFIPSQEDEKARYDLHQNSYDDTKYLAYLDNFLNQAVLPFCKENPQALDFGSGPSPVLAKLLKDKYSIACEIYDPYYAPSKAYLENKYDLITSTEVFEHMTRPREEFLALTGLLNKKGILVLMTEFLPISFDAFTSWYYIRDLTHISFFSLKTLRVIGSQAGLSLIYTDHRSIASFRKD